MFGVILSRKANKFLQGLEYKAKTKVISALEDLTDYPFSLKRHDIKKIQGRENTFRLRVGDIRAIFYVDKNEERVIILKIDYRESVYE
ncbi:MAG: type II toxin-antitoxin system RelE/ParE family toxin [Thaumarchaeota archaeon]|nr:type II toxin-antitoxin system RelE/ParE family toxin [Nitrososphaerota archaeon]